MQNMDLKQAYPKVLIALGVIGWASAAILSAVSFKGSKETEEDE